MCADHVIEADAREFAHFSLADPDEEKASLYEDYCEYAQLFDEWAQELIRHHVTNRPDSTTIEKAKVLLTDRYFDWRVTVPKNHRDRLGTSRHICVMAVFVEHYERLRVLALRAAPSVYAPAAPVKQFREVSGIYLGEILEEGE